MSTVLQEVEQEKQEKEKENSRKLQETIIDQKQTGTISSYSLILSRAEMEQGEQEKEKETDTYWEESCKHGDHFCRNRQGLLYQLLLPYAQQGGVGVGGVGEVEEGGGRQLEAANMENIFAQKQTGTTVSAPTSLCAVGWRWSRRSRRSRRRRRTAGSCKHGDHFRPETDRNHQFLLQSAQQEQRRGNRGEGEKEQGRRERRGVGVWEKEREQEEEEQDNEQEGMRMRMWTRRRRSRGEEEGGERNRKEGKKRSRK